MTTPIEVQEAVVDAPTGTTTDNTKMNDYYAGEQYAMPVMEELPCGGSTSFSEYDTYMEAQKQDAWACDQEGIFHELFKNIMRQDPEEVSISDKLSQVQSLTGEYAARVAQPEEYGYREQAETLVTRAKNFLFGSSSKPTTEQQRSPQGAFFVTKDLDGRWRWLAMHTNKFEDHDKEIFPEAAHKEYEAYVADSHDYPELWLWHVPGSKMGMADMIAYADGFMFSSGTFTYDAVSRGIPQKLKALGPKLGVSHGFTYQQEKKKKRMYHQYRTREISPLPRDKAANPWTEFGVEVNGMAFAKDKRDFFVGVYGEERTSELEKQVGELSKGLEEAGIGWKEIADLLEDPPTTEEPIVDAPNPDEPAERPPEQVAPAAPADEAPPAAPVAEKEVTLGDVVAAINAMGQAQKTFQDDVTTRLVALEKSDDEKVVALRTPAAKAVRPTEDPSNTLPDALAQKILDGQQAHDDKDKDKDVDASTKAARPYIEDLAAVRLVPSAE